MFYSLKKTTLVLAAAASLGIFSSCNKEKEVTPGEETDITVPATYTFESRFAEGESSVSYTGQIARQLLLADIKNVIAQHAKDKATFSKEDVLNRFDHDDAKALPILLGTGDIYQALQSMYTEVSTGKSLKNKTNTSVAVKGFDGNAVELVTAWIDKLDFSKRGEEVYVDASTFVDYDQLINKVLIGALSYNQTAAGYLSDDKLFNADNSAVVDGKTYSQMEHYWDEAFGYFGASREYFSFDDAGLASGNIMKDSNSDGKIDFTSEYNFGLSVNAGKRDNGGARDTDFTKDVFEAFLAGRTAIANQKSVAEIIPHRDAAVKGLEKIIAATAIHYVNETLTDMAYIGDAENHPSYSSSWGTGADAELTLKYKLAKHWSELKGFTVALEFGNPDLSMIKSADLEFLHEKIGKQPVVSEASDNASAAYKEGLNECKTKMQSVYGFSQNAMDTW